MTINPDTLNRLLAEMGLGFRIVPTAESKPSVAGDPTLQALQVFLADATLTRLGQVGALVPPGLTVTNGELRVIAADWQRVLAQQEGAWSVAAVQSGTWTTRPHERRTYFSCSDPFTPAATPTDIWSLAGAGLTLVRVHRVMLFGFKTAEATTQKISLIKRSSLNSGGTAVLDTAVPADAANAAAAAGAVHYTANPTLGDAVGRVFWPRCLVPQTTTLIPPQCILDFRPEANGAQPLILRGEDESLCLNCDGATLTGADGFTVSCQWSEEDAA